MAFLASWVSVSPSVRCTLYIDVYFCVCRLVSVFVSQSLVCRWCDVLELGALEAMRDGYAWVGCLVVLVGDAV